MSAFEMVRAFGRLFVGVGGSFAPAFRPQPFQQFPQPLCQWFCGPVLLEQLDCGLHRQHFTPGNQLSAHLGEQVYQGLLCCGHRLSKDNGATQQLEQVVQYKAERGLEDCCLRTAAINSGFANVGDEATPVISQALVDVATELQQRWSGLECARDAQ